MGQALFTTAHRTLESVVAWLLAARGRLKNQTWENDKSLWELCRSEAFYATHSQTVWQTEALGLSDRLSVSGGHLLWWKLWYWPAELTNPTYAGKLFSTRINEFLSCAFTSCRFESRRVLLEQRENPEFRNV
jgi:hypothetical protein